MRPSPMTTPTRLLAVAVLCAAAVACTTPERRGVVGQQCDKNSECDAPLVCRLGNCRRECRTSSDCIAPSRCVVDEAGLGACLLDDETRCALASDCPAPLICAEMECTNTCATARDCVGGAACVEGQCVDSILDACAGDGDCPLGQMCRAGRCRPDCRDDRDCRNEFVCARVGADSYGVCIPRAFDAAVDAPLDAPPDAAPTGCGAGDGTRLVAGDGADGIPAFALGDNHGCLTAMIGGSLQLACWGSAENGILGADLGGPGSVSPCPVVVAGIDATQIRQLALGGVHSCAAMADGTVLCWGDNSLGALGLGAAVPGVQATPTAVPTVNAAYITAGPSHTCASQVGLNARCWGDNSSGQLGDGGSGFALSPVEVTDVVQPTLMGAGTTFTCATNGSSPSCFGSNSQGQRGEGGGPVMMPGEIGGGAFHACAIDGVFGGDVYCWGRNLEGQLGDGTTTGRDTRVAVTLPTNANHIGIGDYHSCARLIDGTVHCWGRNGNGEAVPGAATGDPVTSPTPITLPGVPEYIAAGARHTCALLTNGEVHCWGQNDLGQLGDGTQLPRATISPVLSP